MSLTATCHCGATRIEMQRLPADIKECNCSYCTRAGAVWGYFRPDELRFMSTEGERTYSASGLNQHHFCGTCGMQTWGDSPDWASLYNPDGTPKSGDAGAMPTDRIYAVNLRLIDDLDWNTITVTKIDGRSSW